MHEVELIGDRYPLIIDIGYSKTSEYWQHPDRIMNMHVCLLILEGKFTVIEDHIEHELFPGDIFFLKQGVHHWGNPTTLPGTAWYWIHFTFDTTYTKHLQEYVPSLNDTITSSENYSFKLTMPKHLSIMQFDYMERKFKELYQMMENHNTFQYIRAGLKTMDLLLYIYELSNQNKETNKSDVMISKIMTYLESKLDQKLDTEEIAGEFQMNYNYMTTLFKSKTGFSINRYHNHLRVQKAAEMFRKTTLNVSQASYELGFPNPYYFSRLFKTFMGLSPTEYMKQLYRSK